MRLSTWRPASLLSALLLVAPCLLPGMTAAAERVSSVDLMTLMKELPTCGLTCSITEIPSRCSSLVDIECICTNEAVRAAMTECVQTACSPIEAIKVSRIDAQMCGTGHRSRAADNAAALAIELPAFFSVGFRLWARWGALGRFEADDWVMIVGWPLFTVFLVLGQYSNALAFGRDIWEVPAERLTLALKLFFIDESFYIAILAVAKLSVLLFLLRIFPQRRFRVLTWAVIGFVLVSNVVFLLLQVFQCWPINYNWQGWKGDYGPHRCINVNMLSYTHASFSIAQDLIILVLPMPLVSRLNMGWRHKTAILVMFGLGIFIIATSSTRLQYMIHFARSTNPTWDYTDALIWSGIEVSVSVLVTSLPAISVYLNNKLPHLFGSRGSSNNSGPGGVGGVGGAGAGAASNSQIKTFGSSQRPLAGGANESKGNVASRMRTALSSTRGGRTRRAQNSVFSLFHDDDGGSAEGNESQLELGERIKGDVQTDIGRGNHTDESDGGGDVVEKSMHGGGSEESSPRLRPLASVSTSTSLPPHSRGTTGIHVRTTTTTMTTTVSGGSGGEPPTGMGFAPLGSRGSLRGGGYQSM